MANIDLKIFDLPMNEEVPESQAKNYEEVEAMIREQADLIENYDAGSLGKLKDYMHNLHKSFSDDPRIVVILTPEARAKYFKGLELLAGTFLDDVVTKKKTPKKTKKEHLPDLGGLI